MGRIDLNKPNFFQSKAELPSDVGVIEAYERSVEEYYYIINPTIKKGSIKCKKKIIEELNIEDIWIYYPWQKKAIHTVNESVYYKLRTARNRNVITENEQQNYRNFRIGIVGLSVGSNALSSLVYTGGPKHIRIADFDTIEVSNLNRIKATLLNIGENKAITAARNTWEVDPFADIDIWGKGVSMDTLEEFILKDKINLFVDTMDNLYLKVQARLLCKKYGVPVLMITENGDSTILDVERYDNENVPLFQGRVSEKDIKNAAEFDQKKWLSFALRIISPEYLTEEMQDSILNLGRTLAGVPQIATSVNIGGSVLAYAVRKIANKYELPTGRYIISLEDKLTPGYNSKEEIIKRAIKTKKLKKRFGLNQE